MCILAYMSVSLHVYHESQILQTRQAKCNSSQSFQYQYHNATHPHHQTGLSLVAQVYKKMNLKNSLDRSTCTLLVHVQLNYLQNYIESM